MFPFLQIRRSRERIKYIGQDYKTGRATTGIHISVTPKLLLLTMVYSGLTLLPHVTYTISANVLKIKTERDNTIV